MSLAGFLLLYVLLYTGYTAASSAWIDYSNNGFATLTHYEIPLGFVAACGCAPDSTYYPTAALSQMAYGSSTAFGPACGRCFNLTLMNTVTADPTFYPNVSKSIVVKVTDLCPLSEDGWCSGTQSKPNSAGNYLNFDLAYPSIAIPDDFFPSDVALYGYADFGVWNVSYQIVSCDLDWSGSTNTSALGTVTTLGPESVCCPGNVTANDTCQSYSDLYGISPTNIPSTSTGSHNKSFTFALWFSIMLCMLATI